MENEVKKELIETEEVVEETVAEVAEEAEVVEEAVAEVAEEAETVEETVAEVAEEAEVVEEVAEEAAEEEVAEVVEEAPAAEVAEEAVVQEAPAAEAAEEVVEDKPSAIGKRITSGLFGAAGILTSSTSILGIIFGIISICLGFSAKKKSGKGKFAISLGFISLILGVLVLALVGYVCYCMFTNFDWAAETFGFPQELIDTWNEING